MKKRIAVLLIMALGICCMGAVSRQTQKDTAHQIAELARSLELPEDDPIIKRAQELWWEAHWRENTYSDEDLRILTAVIHHESCGCPEWHKELVGAVVMNRVRRADFPNTVRGVVAAPGQYAVWYTTTTANCQSCREIAQRVLAGGVDCPENVVYQANFMQGTGLYRESYVNTSWFRSTTYFCYG